MRLCLGLDPLGLPQEAYKGIGDTLLSSVIGHHKLGKVAILGPLSFLACVLCSILHVCTIASFVVLLVLSVSCSAVAISLLAFVGALMLLLGL